MIELEHSPLGGSSAFRFMNCFGSFFMHREQLRNGTFENIETEYAKLGTAAHELGAEAIGTQREPYEFLGEEYGGYRVGWPDEISMDALHVYFNKCMEVISTARPSDTILIEQTIHLPEIHPLLKGTVDFGSIASWRGVDLVDYKNGEGIGVPAVGNRQLSYYGFLLVMSDPWVRSAPRDLPMRLGIVQPNHFGFYEEPEVWETNIGHILDWGHDELLPTMDTLLTRQEYSREDFHGGEHCQFCPVMLDCPLMREAFDAFANASEDFITMLTNEELDGYYSQIEFARRFMNLLKETVRARKIAGGNIPSAKLVEKKVARVWKPGAAAAIMEAFGDKAMKPAELKSPAQIEKLSSRGKELALEYGYKPESAGLTIAPLSDPRAEAKPRTNATVFGDYQQSNEQMGF